jgi:aminoglycoside phosphotransferase (APT) family kinase protein
MPAAEVDVDVDLVRRLLVAQFPDLLEGDPEIRPVAFGWDNVIVRLGDDLVVRLPRRQQAAELVVHEQRWLAQLAPALPLPVPAPVRCGVPGEGYPWPWTVCPWLEGAIAATTPPDDQAEAAGALAGFLAALHRPAPADAPVNPYRGGPLAERDPFVRERAAALDGALCDATEVVPRWEAALAAPPHGGPPVWLHGDLHPANLLVAGGRLSAVIDFGDLTAGDPATDLAVAWMLFDASERSLLRRLTGADDATWRRARGWAIHLSLAYLANSADHPVIAGVGRRTLAAVLGDDDDDEAPA